jgi:hypothetical protein
VRPHAVEREIALDLHAYAQGLLVAGVLETPAALQGVELRACVTAALGMCRHSSGKQEGHAADRFWPASHDNCAASVRAVYRI